MALITQQLKSALLNALNDKMGGSGPGVLDSRIKLTDALSEAIAPFIIGSSGVTEVDPIFMASVAHGITDININGWNEASLHTIVEGLINGLVKCDGAGGYSAIADNSGNWNTAYTQRGYVGTKDVNETDIGDGKILRYDSTSGKLVYINKSILNVVTKTSGYTLTVDDDVVLCNGTFNLNILTAVGIGGKLFQIKDIGTGVITVLPNGAETIDGETSMIIDSQWCSMDIVSDDANWFIR